MRVLYLKYLLASFFYSEVLNINKLMPYLYYNIYIFDF